jgi:hypothetical protein
MFHVAFHFGHGASHPRIVEIRRLGLVAGPSSPPGSASPRVIAKRLTCLDIFLLPHFGQAGWRPGFTRFARKLKIRRHFGQANS